jgi:hypothetical protein
MSHRVADPYLQGWQQQLLARPQRNSAVEEQQTRTILLVDRENRGVWLRGLTSQHRRQKVVVAIVMPVNASTSPVHLPASHQGHLFLFNLRRQHFKLVTLPRFDSSAPYFDREEKLKNNQYNFVLILYALLI